MELLTSLSTSRDQAQITISMDGKSVGWVGLDASDLEAFIKVLSSVRSAMTDQVPTELDPGIRLEVVADPAWRTPAHRYDDGRVLALRHPGLGWLYFLLPEKEAAAIALEMTRDLPVDP